MKEKIFSLWHLAARLIGSVSHSSVTHNAVSLYVIQFANYILPLVTVPYLVRVLEPKGYGVVAFGQSLIGFFALFVDYGFALSATRNISVKRNDPAAVNRIVFNVWGAKILLACAGFAVLLLLVAVIPKLGEVALLVMILYGIVIGNVLFPTWLFQGMEKMVVMSVINLAIRCIFVIGIFITVHRPEHYLLYAGLTSLSFIAAGIVGAIVAILAFKLRLVFPSWRSVWEALVEGWTLFLSMASVSLFTVGNAFILGLLTNHAAVGYYNPAEKIMRALSELLGPISHAVYPRFSRLATASKIQALKKSGQFLILMSLTGILLSAGLFFGAEIIVRIYLGPSYYDSIIVMRILAAFVFINAVTNVFGIQIMLPFGHDRAFAAILFGAGLINIALAAFLVPLWKQVGMALAVLSSGIFVIIAQALYLYTHHLLPSFQAGERTHDTLENVQETST